LKGRIKAKGAGKQNAPFLTNKNNNMPLELTPKQPPYYKTVDQINKLVYSKSEYTSVPNGTTLKYGEYTIAKNTMKTGHGLEITLWTTGGQAACKLTMAGTLIEAPVVSGGQLQTIKWNIWYKDATKGNLTRDGLIYYVSYGQEIAALDWTIDNLVEIEVNAQAVGINIVALRIQYIYPNT